MHNWAVQLPFQAAAVGIQLFNNATLADVFARNPNQHTLPETNMETQKEPYKDYSPSKKGAIWVSMLVWGSVGFRV